jgi:hypothetical protein
VVGELGSSNERTCRRSELVADEACQKSELAEEEELSCGLTSYEGEDDDDDGAVCESCGDDPCVWLREMENGVAVDEMEHAGTSTVNSSRRKVAYRHMFLVINGGPGMKGVRKQLPSCVEKGVRALFPDSKGSFMGFKEA